MDIPTRCDNCGELAKESDVICWHCGQVLPGRDEEFAKAAPVKSGWRQTVTAGTVGFYLAITLLIVTASLLLMASLGDRPRVQIGFGTRVPNSWRIITDRNENFTAFLPESWISLDGGDLDEVPLLTELLARSPDYYGGVGPLGQAVDDLDLFFVGYQPSGEAGPQSFLVVGRSARLNRLSYDQARSLLSGPEFPVRDIRFVDDFDKSHLSIVAEPMAAGNSHALSCWQQFIPGLNFALLAATCSLQQDASRIPAFNTIHSSFQRLAP